MIDGIGRYSVYGLLEEYDKAKQENLLPVGLSQGCILKKDMEKNQLIKYNDVNLIEDSLVLQLRILQDQII